MKYICIEWFVGMMWCRKKWIVGIYRKSFGIGKRSG
jgi:hypothetical protein